MRTPVTSPPTISASSAKTSLLRMRTSCAVSGSSATCFLVLLIRAFVLNSPGAYSHARMTTTSPILAPSFDFTSFRPVGSLVTILALACQSILHLSQFESSKVERRDRALTRQDPPSTP
ncbi:hypothetical protein BC827DRAFT_1220927 [Russula dissimulans]|nr:hypothetical protein BC827DRAFT_1220927 [Russula dissimulans]